MRYARHLPSQLAQRDSGNDERQKQRVGHERRGASVVLGVKVFRVSRPLFLGYFR